MSTTIETDDDLAERIERHLGDDESMAEFLDELVTVYETEDAFLEGGYSEYSSSTVRGRRARTESSASPGETDPQSDASVMGRVDGVRVRRAS